MPKLLLAASCMLMQAPATAETPGKDGSLTVSAAGTVVNQYAAVGGSASAGAASITAIDLASAMPGLAAGDLIMIYQAQGAAIDPGDTAAYGAVTAYNSAGRYEFQTVGSVSGNTITFATYNGTCSGLKFPYSAAGNAQIVRVPQYRNLVVPASTSIAARPWDGTTGGILAVTVSQNFTLNGSLSASGAGFRGGATDDAVSGFAVVGYRSAAPEDGGEKGEGIGGYRAALPGGNFYGRGAPANGGGGGNAHNAGGGGGANGDNGNGWAGQGRPDTSGPGWADAWNLDGTLNATTSNAGGGRGGYSFAFGNGDALTQGPGENIWNGDYRQQSGGLGGRPLAFDRAGRVFFGGGGGAGDGNNAGAGAGGRGGGFVFVRAASVSGSGMIVANGTAGAATAATHNDAPGGGGGGGTVIAQLGGTGMPGFAANGGAGGNQLIASDESEGPGGGGGGGVIAASGGGSRVANGGANGTTGSSAMTEFTPNGATQGGGGNPNAMAPGAAETPICYAPPPTVVKTGASYATTGINRFNVPGADLIYTITMTNPGTALDNGTLVLTDLLPPELEFYNGDIDDAGPQTGPFEFVDGTTASGVACCSGAQIAYSAQVTGADFSYVPAAGYDPAVRRIRLMPTGSMAPGSFDASSFSVRLRGRIK